METEQRSMIWVSVEINALAIVHHDQRGYIEHLSVPTNRHLDFKNLLEVCI